MEFWTGGAKYYFRFFQIALVMIGIFVLAMAILWLPFMYLMGRGMEFFDTEMPLIYLSYSLVALTVLMCLFYYFLVDSFPLCYHT